MKKIAIKFFEKYFIYVFAFCVLAINFTLIFDNVVWGDEAFSGNIISHTNYYGIYQRIFYWENHPPLYYYYLRVFADILGYKTWVYHLASFLPFLGCNLLALIFFIKRLGNFPVLFFVLISGLSAVCVEYNVEIRMYEICFLFIFVACFFSYELISKIKWQYLIGIVMFGVLAAYTHYYGLVTSGILLFCSSVVFFLKKKGKSWICGVLAIATYILLYSPWLAVFIRQMGYVSNSWWMTEPDSLDKLLTFMFGGGRLYKSAIAFFVVSVIVVFACDFGSLNIAKKSKSEYAIKFAKPRFSPSIQLQVIMCLLASMIMVIGFSYVLCAVYKPVLTARYMHPLIPVMLTCLMLAISRVIEIAKKWDIQKFVFGILSILFSVMTILGLLDFKYFRSVSRVQEVKTQEVLEMIGDAGEDTTFTSLAVPHLAWTVLYYYFPDSPIIEGYPDSVDKDVDNIWSFYTVEFSEWMISDMENAGYTVEEYPNIMFSKYNCYLYHFYHE